MPVADNLGLIQTGVPRTANLADNDTSVCGTPQYLLVGGSETNITVLSININTGEATFTVTASGAFSFQYERICSSVSEGIALVSGTGFNCTPVAITTHPQSIIVCNSTETNLSLVATGTDLQYQWKINGVNILGATSSTYLASFTGNYSVEIYNLCSSIISQSANVSFKISPFGGSAFPPILQNSGVNYYKSLNIIGTPPFNVVIIQKESWINFRLVGNFFEVYGTPKIEDVHSAQYHFQIHNSCGHTSVFSLGGRVTLPCIKPFNAEYIGEDLIEKSGTSTQTVKYIGTFPATYLHTTSGEIIGENNLSSVVIKDTECDLILTTVITNSCGSSTISKTIKTKRPVEFTHPLDFECYLTPYSIKVIGDNIERFVSFDKNSITFNAAFGIQDYEILFNNKFGNIVKKYLNQIED